METRNAIIESAKITNDDHGLLTAWLYLDFGGSGQGFGGYGLYLPEGFKNKKDSPNYAGHFIWRVMEVAEVSEWSQLAGRTIRVKHGHGDIDAIGHIVKENWFYPKTEFQQMEFNNADNL